MSLHHINKQKVKVTLQTKITFGQDTEAYELITFGTSVYKGDTLYIQYTEENEAGSTNTTIKHKENETLLLRSGVFKMRQVFRLNELTDGYYESIYGRLGTQTKTKVRSYHWDEQAREGKLTLRYTLQMQGSEPGQYEMTISYKEETAK